MTTYRAAAGHNVALGSLTVLSPQPDEEHGGGIEYTRVMVNADGSVTKEGPFFPFHWDEVSASQYDTILTAFGLASANSAVVTVYVRDDDVKTWVRKNGTALKPLPGDTVQWNNRPRDITIIVRSLENVA